MLCAAVWVVLCVQRTSETGAGAVAGAGASAGAGTGVADADFSKCLAAAIDPGVVAPVTAALARLDVEVADINSLSLATVKASEARGLRGDRCVCRRLSVHFVFLFSSRVCTQTTFSPWCLLFVLCDFVHRRATAQCDTGGIFVPRTFIPMDEVVDSVAVVRHREGTCYKVCLAFSTAQPGS